MRVLRSDLCTLYLRDNEVTPGIRADEYLAYAQEPKAIIALRAVVFCEVFPVHGINAKTRLAGARQITLTNTHKTGLALGCSCHALAFNNYTHRKRGVNDGWGYTVHMPFKSKAQARKMYELQKQGKISHKTLMEHVHATPNLSKLPEHVKPKGNTQTKTELAIKGLV